MNSHSGTPYQYIYCHMFKAALWHYMNPHPFFLLHQGPGYKETGDGVYSFTSTGRFGKRRQSDLHPIVCSQALLLHVCHHHLRCGGAGHDEHGPLKGDASSDPGGDIPASDPRHVIPQPLGPHRGRRRARAENVVARDDAALWIEANPKPDGSVVKPNDVWSGDWRRMKIGGFIFDL